MVFLIFFCSDSVLLEIEVTSTVWIMGVARVCHLSWHRASKATVAEMVGAQCRDG